MHWYQRSVIPISNDEDIHQDGELPEELSMMLHFLRNECSSLLCESVQGEYPFINLDYLYRLLYFITQMVVLAISMIFGWKVKKTEEEEIRADRWYYKKMDKMRDNPEQ